MCDKHFSWAKSSSIAIFCQVYFKNIFLKDKWNGNYSFLKETFISSSRFHANVRVVNEEQKILLYPVPNRREDFVESQLRKLRKSLKDEAMKKRRPPPFVDFSMFEKEKRVERNSVLIYRKDFQPYVYNNLNPYFDTNDVDKAIHEVFRFSFICWKWNIVFSTFEISAVRYSWWLLHKNNSVAHRRALGSSWNGLWCLLWNE